MKNIKDYINEQCSGKYHYNKDTFNPSDCLTWLIKSGCIEKYSSDVDVEEYAQNAQYAAEDAGVPTEDAERVYDCAFERFM